MFLILDGSCRMWMSTRVDKSFAAIARNWLLPLGLLVPLLVASSIFGRTFGYVEIAIPQVSSSQSYVGGK
jgi:hypothetical protein